jgi:hypothetical protein
MPSSTLESRIKVLKIRKDQFKFSRRERQKNG